MESPQPNKPPCERDDALRVLLRLREAGHVAYFAGGCVRDLQLGLAPKDYDVATDAPPAKVRSLFPRTQSVGAAFGVILVHEKGSTVEVATFRSDGTYLDGRRPATVEFSTPEADAQRRDFTINGLFLDPVDNRVIDYVGGMNDLAERRLRAIGDPAQRFAEDHLRLLRAVRFAARFALTVDPATASAIRRSAPQLRRISPERIADELRTILSSPTRAVAWPMLWEFALVDEIFRFLPTAGTVEFSPIRSIFLSLTPGGAISFGLALAAATLCYRWQSMKPASDFRTLLAPTSVRQMVQAMRQALRLSNEESDVFSGTLSGLLPLLEDQPPRVSMKKRFLAEPTSRLSRDLLDAMASVGQFSDRIAELRAEFTSLETTDFAPVPLINGDDLTELGMKPGRIFKKVLTEVYDAQLESRIENRDQAIALALEIAR